MRDQGLEEAVRAVGGVSELARQIGISQPSVSNWNRVPAERVLIVEAATGINRKVLRPDLYGAPEQEQSAPDDVAVARAQEYAPLGVVRAALAQAASETSVERVEREYFDLFIGLGRGELLPYASYYLTGFLHERPLARLRSDLAPLGIERAEGNSEPEDHAATLCEIMAGLVSGGLPAPHGTDQQIFEKHLST